MRILVSLAVVCCALASCGRNADTEPALKAAPAPQTQSPPPSRPRFFIGDWAVRADMCGEPWRITDKALVTPGEVACQFQEIRGIQEGFSISAICTAEGPPTSRMLKFAYAQSADALLVSGGPFADVGLVRCSEAQPIAPPEPGQPGGLPDDRTPLAEGPFTPESAQGAADVVQTYYALIGERKFRDAWALWSDQGRASGLTADAFERELSSYRQYDAQIGAPGRIEGAAGSLYVETPVTIYGRRGDGTALHQSGVVTLRRVNDVPGSTAEQRRWRIVRIELKPAPEHGRAALASPARGAPPR